MKELNDILKEVERKESKCRIRKLLVFESPLTKDLEYRVAYFVDTPEANDWERYMNNVYDVTAHKIYTDYMM